MFGLCTPLLLIFGLKSTQQSMYFKTTKIKTIDNVMLILTEKLGNRDYLLTLEKVTIDDDAEYTVIAKNLAGEAKSRAQLIVEHSVIGE